MFTCSPQEKIIVEFIKMTPFKSLHIRNTVLLPEWSTAVFLFSDSCSVESLVCPEQLNFLLFFRKILQHFCVFEPFPTMTVGFWDPYFHTEDNWGTHATITEDLNTHWCSRRKKTCIKGVKTFKYNENVYIFHVLPKYHIFFHLVLPFRSYKI